MRIDAREMEQTMKACLLKNGVPEAQADVCAKNMTENSLYGVGSHGVNRFARIISMIRKGIIRPGAAPTLLESYGALEKWDGNLGLGNCNAAFCMDRAVVLAEKFGIGCVALRNTNHWLRAGAYGIQAAKANCVGICWTNTQPNMPVWGGKDRRIGNNPLVMCMPYRDGYVMTDGAMAQFSYGAIEKARLAGKRLPVCGGYDAEGNLSDDPAAIEETWRVLPIGFWKGSGFSILMDVIAAGLSEGRTVQQIAANGGTAEDEYGLSQVFIAISLLSNPGCDALLTDTIEYIKASQPARNGGAVFYPGEQSQAAYLENVQNGIEVNDQYWQNILAL